MTEQKDKSEHLILEQRKMNLLHRQLPLAARLRTGDHNAAIELVDRYYDQIYLYLRRLGHDRQTSEDLTQDSFLSAWRHIGQLRDNKALSGWLYRIAGNISKLYWRKHKEITGIEHADLPDFNNTASDKVRDYEELEFLRDAVSRLPLKLRQTIILHYMQQLTIAESADAIGIREGTFKSRLNRALNILRKQTVKTT